MALASSGMLMVTFSKVILSMNRQMGMEYLCIRTEVDMRDFGKMMFKMAKVKKYFLMVLSMMENIKEESLVVEVR